MTAHRSAVGGAMTDETRQSTAETVSHARTPWRCFHCDDVFTSRSEASAHFGYQVDATPACKIAPDLRGLVKFVRWQEGQLQRFRQEDSEAARQLYALGADHARALRCEEEKGYARGVSDTSKEVNAVAIRERIAEGDGMWMTCSGCHESEDGHDVGHYPHSEVFGCKLGSGCGECGGIGAIWDTTDYGAMADALNAEMQAEQLSKSHRAEGD
jgi:hypothetical protein